MARRKIIFSILAFLVALMVLPVNGIMAGWMQCRSDPVVILSNGIVMDLSADISVYPWQVQQVDYTLHVPAGVSLVAVIPTPLWVTTIETFNLVDDAPPGEYHSVTTVYTSKRRAQVTANNILLSATGIQLDLQSASGIERRPIHIFMHTP